MNIPKFRAWIKEFKVMLDVECIDFNEREVYCGWTDEGELLYSFDDIILMQSTGHQDKNKTDVFRLDVLKHPVSEQLFYVEWFDAYSGHRAVYEDGSTSSLAFQLDKGEAIVVGNLFEDPELMEVCS